MQTVLNSTDFEAARAVRSAKLNELGFVAVCMAPGEANDGHSHTIVEEMLIVQKGHGQIQIENDTFDLCPGSVAIVPAGKFHAVCNTGSENLEAVTVFNSNFDRKKVVLKSRDEHFPAKKTSAEDKLKDELKALKKTNKKLKKKLKKAKK
ncbi:MAG: cupin domain-containing protein [Pseudomonadaceae bacterium]|nr:cupin domain-containing protein [Pseudomonadaceae bacterium]